MSDRGHSKERDNRRSRRRSHSSRSKSRQSRSPSTKRSSRSTSNHRSRRTSASPRGQNRSNNDAHRENPVPSSVLGVFGLSQYTNERDLKELFRKFGSIKDVQIVIDKKTNKSRGFGFVYFDEVESATRAKEAMNSVEIDNHRLRIDYSVTKRAHTPTPGIYMGVRPSSYYRSNGHNYRRSPSPDRRSYRRRHRHHYDRSRSRSRTKSRSRSHSRSRRHAERRRRSSRCA